MSLTQYRGFFLGVSILSSLSTPLFAGEGDIPSYNLFNPVPESLMKDMSADRPDKTEGPYVIDAGHYQIEADLFTYTRDRRGADIKTTSYTIFGPNIRIGILPCLEFNVIMATYNKERIKHETKRGFGDTIVRLKYNFWGNDGKGKTALGVIPFVKFPTNQDDLGNNSVEGGIILPFDIKFTDNISLGVMTQINMNKSNNNHSRVAEFVNSGSLSYDFTDKLNGFAELYTSKSTDGGADWENTVDFGVTYSITKNFQVDAGVNIGVSKAADDFNPFVGASIRF